MNFEIFDFYNPWWRNQDLRDMKEHLLKEYTGSTLQRDYSGYFNTEGNGLYILKGPQVEPSILAECVVLKELLDYATDIEEGLVNLLDLGYWYSDKGKEVDFIVERIPIESKFKTKVKEPDKRSILKNFKEGIILSKEEIDFSGAVKVIPIHLFLALISPSRNHENVHSA